MSGSTRTASLPSLPASDVKKRGWRGLMRALHKDGAVVVTNHREPEAVILQVAEYEALIDLVEKSKAVVPDELQTLRQRFDQRLAALRAPDAGDRLRALARLLARLGGKVKAGQTF